MRAIHIGLKGGTFAAVEISDGSASELMGLKILYPCGDGHDLHLDPDRLWELKDIEALLKAIARK